MRENETTCRFGIVPRCIVLFVPKLDISPFKIVFFDCKEGYFGA